MQTLCLQIETGEKYSKLTGTSIPDKDKIAIGHKLVHRTDLFHQACRHLRENPNNASKKWALLKEHFTKEHQDFKDDTKQSVTTSSFKANQMLQNITTQVLNQINVDALKDETKIDNLRATKTQLLCQAASYNTELETLKTIAKDLKCVVEQLSLTNNGMNSNRNK